MKYPLEKKKNWHTDQDYKETDGKLVKMSPEKFLKKVRRLNMDDHDDAILKRQLKDLDKGEHMEPMQLRADGTEDGRHRALAAMVKGIDKVPVLKWPDRKDPGETNKGVMGTIKKVVKKFRNNEKLNEITQTRLRGKLNSYMTSDQGTSPEKRSHIAKMARKTIQRNQDLVWSDKGSDGKGGYPHAPYAAWLHAQHADDNPKFQKQTLSHLQKNFPQHEKVPFLRDRIAVNQEINKLHSANPKAYKDKSGKRIISNPTAAVRDSSRFGDAEMGTNPKTAPTSANQALGLAKQHGNELLHTAVSNVRKTSGMGQTQPSYMNKTS